MGLFGPKEPAWKTDKPRRLSKALAAVDKEGSYRKLSQIAIEAPLEQVALRACERLVSHADDAYAERALRDVADGASHASVGAAATAAVEELDKRPDHLARNPETPQDVLDDLAANADAGIRSSVASNPSTCIETLVKLAGDQDPSVLKMVAANRAMPPETLAQLAKVQDEDVLRAVAANPSTPFAEALRLVEDERLGLLRSTLASNTTASPEFLLDLYREYEQLYKEWGDFQGVDDEFFKVRDALETNPAAKGLKLRS